MDITGLLRNAVAITLLSAAQAIDLRKGAPRTGGGTSRIYRAVRDVSAYVKEDRALDGTFAQSAVSIEGRNIPWPHHPPSRQATMKLAMNQCIGREIPKGSRILGHLLPRHRRRRCRQPENRSPLCPLRIMLHQIDLRVQEPRNIRDQLIPKAQ